MCVDNDMNLILFLFFLQVKNKPHEVQFVCLLLSSVRSWTWGWGYDVNWKLSCGGMVLSRKQQNAAEYPKRNPILSISLLTCSVENVLFVTTGHPVTRVQYWYLFDNQITHLLEILVAKVIPRQTPQYPPCILGHWLLAWTWILPEASMVVPGCLATQRERECLSLWVYCLP